MASSSDAHDRVVESAEHVFHDVAASCYIDEIVDLSVEMWHDFSQETDLGRTKKPETWAAALFYVTSLLRYDGYTQEEVADMFDVSAITVSKKYREIANTLDVKLFDDRYTTEAERSKYQSTYGVQSGASLTEFNDDAASYGWFYTGEDVPQELVYDGWEALNAGSIEEARSDFEDAIELDPNHADAHNGLAGVAMGEGDLERAHELYRKAYELARRRLGTESPQAFYWWSELETRPYMRARHGLGITYWRLGEPEKAASEFEALLELNPNDNLGVRYLIGTMHLLAGHDERALDFFRRYEEEYSQDRSDPLFTFSWGIALLRDEQPMRAVDRWRTGIFQNVFVVPYLVDEVSMPDEQRVAYLFHTESPDAAEDLADRLAPLWDETPHARTILKRLWNDSEVQEDLETWMSLGEQLLDLSESMQKGGLPNSDDAERLYRRQEGIKRKSLSEQAVRRILDPVAV
jgi:tetratricopeptide (TPR) repeat protein